MRKHLFLTAVLIALLSVAGNAQTEEKKENEKKGSVFFETAFYRGFFPNEKVDVLDNFWVNRLDSLKLGGYNNFPTGPGYTLFGLEAAYSSGSRFGGKGSVDFFPLTLNAGYLFSIADILLIGPNVKLGGFLMSGPDWTKIVPLVGARLEAELRYKYFPLSI
jgi:hypothetical protein